uniref:Uncharacterized protein n=1 Tax=Arundo donax TaxID=35708 RepID=A0A0A9FD09_ARUDO
MIDILASACIYTNIHICSHHIYGLSIEYVFANIQYVYIY